MILFNTEVVSFMFTEMYLRSGFSGSWSIAVTRQESKVWTQNQTKVLRDLWENNLASGRSAALYCTRESEMTQYGWLNRLKEKRRNMMWRRTPPPRNAWFLVFCQNKNITWYDAEYTQSIFKNSKYKDGWCELVTSLLAYFVFYLHHNSDDLDASHTVWHAMNLQDRCYNTVWHITWDS